MHINFTVFSSPYIFWLKKLASCNLVGRKTF